MHRLLFALTGSWAPASLRKTPAWPRCGGRRIPPDCVDARRSLDDPWPALARVLWLALAVLLVAVHLPLALARWRAAAARRR
ncbi:hypothetical protein FGX01_02825, partial [Xylella fastidiosa subsp. multiplex]|nr:hypothetical protein [Xylella fastidiosa subsp. multiplex]